MRALSFIFTLIALTYSFNVSGQFSIQTNFGIENPYHYVYVVNVTPNTEEVFERQDFNFFRTRIGSIGITYDYPVPMPVLKNKIILNGGLNLGFMNQFVADTIANPANNKLIFNARHRNIFLAPEFGLRFKLHKFISFTSGLEIFIPLRKWINSDDGNDVFLSEYSPQFYTINTYLSLGLEFDLKVLRIGLKFQTFGEADHWIEMRPLIDFYHDHDLERWMINLKYDL